MNEKRYSLWWGREGLVLNFPYGMFVFELTHRHYHPDTKWIDGSYTDAILNRLANEPSGIVLIATTPAFITPYGDRVPARGYQIIWKEVEQS